MEGKDVSTTEKETVVSEETIIDRILEAHGHIAPPPGAFTVRDYCERARVRGVIVSEPNALRVLMGEVGTGRLKSRKFPVDGRERWVFWE